MKFDISSEEEALSARNDADDPLPDARELAAALVAAFDELVASAPPRKSRDGHALIMTKHGWASCFRVQVRWVVSTSSGDCQPDVRPSPTASDAREARNTSDSGHRNRPARRSLTDRTAT